MLFILHIFVICKMAIEFLLVDLEPLFILHHVYCGTMCILLATFDYPSLHCLPINLDDSSENLQVENVHRFALMAFGIAILEVGIFPQMC